MVKLADIVSVHVHSFRQMYPVIFSFTFCVCFGEMAVTLWIYLDVYFDKLAVALLFLKYDYYCHLFWVFSPKKYRVSK